MLKILEWVSCFYFQLSLKTYARRYGKIVYLRVNEQYSGHFPATDFKDFARYYNEIYKADRNKIVLVKKTE